MKTLKNKLFAGLLGASLVFGAGDKTKAQEENVEFYNHDEDKFPEEIICWQKEGFNEAKQKYMLDKMGITIIYCEDKDNDNFHENIKIFNCSNYHYINYSNLRTYWGITLITEDFYIKKSTGLIDYSKKESFISLNKWNKHFANKKFIELVKEGLSDQFDSTPEFYPYLTPQKLYEMGIDERVKTLINTCESRDISEIKRLAEVERNYFKANN